MIGEVIRVTRVANDITKKDLAQKSKVSNSYLHDIETNNKKNISYEILKKISTACNLSLSELLEINEYHDFLLEEKLKKTLQKNSELENLKIYQQLLLKILKTYREKDTSNHKLTKSKNK